MSFFNQYFEKHGKEFEFLLMVQLLVCVSKEVAKEIFNKWLYFEEIKSLQSIAHVRYYVLIWYEVMKYEEIAEEALKLKIGNIFYEFLFDKS